MLRQMAIYGVKIARRNQREFNGTFRAGPPPDRGGRRRGVAGLDRRAIWQQHGNAEATGREGAGQAIGYAPGPEICA
jgi:hypothetical protein